MQCIPTELTSFQPFSVAFDHRFQVTEDILDFFRLVSRRPMILAAAEIARISDEWAFLTDFPRLRAVD